MKPQRFPWLLSWLGLLLWLCGTPPCAGADDVPAAGPLVLPRQPDGTGAVTLAGELKQWHKLTLTLAGPFAHERDRDPNPFLDYRLTVTFTHAAGGSTYRVPGYFAADGHAAHTSAEAGTAWRAHFAPDRPGVWRYTVSFVRGPQAALEPDAPGTALAPYDGPSGTFTIAPTDKTGRDFRSEGRLEYVNRHHLRFAGSGRYFLKAGADAPESLLAYAEFDGTRELRPADAPRRAGEATPKGLHRYGPHVRDWQPGDPTWKDGLGKGLIGALNYLAGKGCNAFSFLPYNVGGDGENVWPFVEPTDKLHYDCSKLDQWGIVFDHATARGLYLHFKLQENEMDDDRLGHEAKPGLVPAALDGGRLGTERKLYCRELIARFAHALALNWNLGEENTQSTEEVRDMARYLHATDPYRHHLVIHTFPDWQDRVYPPLLGTGSALSGASLQNSWSAVHQRTLQWVRASAQSGRPWVVANDEQNPADMGVPPDPGYEGHDGVAVQNGQPYTLHDIRKATLWGNLLAGGAGVEYYFGYKLPQNDLMCEDWRSRDRSWDYARIALQFFRHTRIPFWDMTNADASIGNAAHDNRKYCLAKPGAVYLVYLPQGGSADLDLGDTSGPFTVRWFDPRAGGPLQRGSVGQVTAPGTVALGEPPVDPGEDWLVVVRRPAPASAADSASGGGVLDFERQRAGRAPRGWTFGVTGAGSARWAVQSEADAPTGTNVLAQTAALPKPSFAVALKDTPALGDGYVETRFKPVSGAIDQAGGVVWRAADARNYYVCRANALERNVVLYKVVEGKRTPLDLVGRTGGYGLETAVAKGQWHTLRVEFVGSRFRVSFNGAPLFEVVDASLAAAGRVGLWTKADSVTWFDHFRFGPVSPTP